MSARKPFTDAELASSVTWLARLTWAGRDWYWATDDVVITDADSVDRVHHSGLSVQWLDEMDLFGQSPAVPEVTLGPLTLHEPGFSIPEQIERGNEVAGAACEIALWTAGRTWEERVVVLRGTARLPGYGTTAEGLSFVIRPQDYADDALGPAPRFNVEEGLADGPQTFAFDVMVSEGAIAPTIIGRPGQALAAGGTNQNIVTMGGSPAIPMDYAAGAQAAKLIIAAHKVVSATVDVIQIRGEVDSGALAADWPTMDPALAVSHGADTSGAPIAYVTLTSGGTPAPFGSAGTDRSLAGEYWVSWRDDDKGGLPSWRNPGQALRGAGEVCLHFLRVGGVVHDAAAWLAALDVLDGYKIDGYLDRPINAWAFLQSEIFPLLPLSLGYGADGVYPIVWRPDPRAADAVAHLTAWASGGPLIRQGDVRIEDAHVANEHEIAFAPRSDNGQPGARLLYTGNRKRLYGSAYIRRLTYTTELRQSVDQFGPRVAPVLETAFVYDETTAHRVLAWRAAAYSHPWRLVTYTDPSAAAAWLKPGDLVTITDSDLAWSSRLAWVRSVDWQNDDPAIELLLMHHQAPATPL